MLRFIICEDNKDFRDRISNIINKINTNYSDMESNEIIKYLDSILIEIYRLHIDLKYSEVRKLKKEIIYYDDNASTIIGKVKVSLNDKEYFNEDIYIKKEVKEVKLNFFQKIIKRIKELW